MKVVQNKVTDYLSANFSETETAWSSGATYNYADEARDGHYIYAYAGASGTNSALTPSLDSLELTPLWVRVRPTNYYAMLDGVTSTQTSNADTIVVTIPCNNYDSFSLLEVEGSTVDISLYDNTTTQVVYTNSYNLQNESEIVDFYTYCFSEFNFRPSVFEGSMPLYTDAELTITITNTGSLAKCGRLVFGRSFYIGDTSYGANLSLESYSRKVTDEFGNTSLQHIGSVNYDSYEVLVPTEKIPSLKRKAQELDAKAILFIMDESSTSNLENLLNFGYWDNFSMVIPSPVKSTISLTIKGIL